MRIMTIIIPDTPPSNNQFIGRNNRWSYQDYKKKWKLMIRSAMTYMPKVTMEFAKVHIHYTFPDRIRRDPDNFSGKILIDPLVQYGIIKDDNFNCIELV